MKTNKRKLWLQELHFELELNEPEAVAKVHLHKCHCRFLDGDENVLPDAIYVCMECGVAPPHWLAKNYKKKFDEIAELRARSWDEVFGKPVKKYSHLAKRGNDLAWAVRIRFEVGEIHESGTPLDQCFVEVGERNGISASLCNKIYYSFSRKKRASGIRLTMPLEEARRRLRSLGTKETPEFEMPDGYRSLGQVMRWISEARDEPDPPPYVPK